MPSPCVNAPLHIKTDGSLELQGARSAAWPFAGAIGTYNGLAVDPGTGNGWAPPVPGGSNWYTSAVGPVGPSDGGNDRSGSFTGIVASTPSVTITNTDVNYSAIVLFVCTLDMDVSTFGSSIITMQFFLNIPAGTAYVNTSTQSNQYLAHANSEGVGQHKSTTFSYGYSLGAGATITYNASCNYSISAIANASQVVTVSMAARAYLFHT